jgi:hypothetical protein
LALVICYQSCSSELSLSQRTHVAFSVIAILLSSLTTLISCYVSLVFYFWSIVQCLRFYRAFFFQAQIQQANRDIEQQERIHAQGGDGRSLFQRFVLSNFSDQYSREAVNQRNLAAARTEKRAADAVASVECAGCYVPDLGSNVQKPAEVDNFRRWANFWASL